MAFHILLLYNIIHRKKGCVSCFKIAPVKFLILGSTSALQQCSVTRDQQTTSQVSFTIFGCFGVNWEIRNEITKSVERFEELTDFHNVQTY